MHTDVCYGLIYDLKKDKILLVQNEHGGWSFPGGAAQPSETLQEALFREIKEETGLDIQVIKHIETTERFSPTHDIFHLFYVVLKDRKGYGALLSSPSPDEIQMIQWVAVNDVGRYLPWYQNGIHHLIDKIDV